MNISRFLLEVSILSIAVFLTSCDTRIPERPLENSAPESTKSPLERHAQVKRENAPMKVTAASATPSEALVAKLRGPRAGNDAVPTITAMVELLDHWSPVGEDVRRVTEILGPPSRESNNELVYMFDTGFQAYQWHFLLDKQIVTSVALKPYE